ncbi:sugar ABC transporter ATP-binding protein [Candidatus Deferrimicrobium sp.]|uniref:sugar ABC transporter ATP-binding protein n=1 Tax=Candidatus Deferrimicrobium sp. TaxID=3060586 RepID=UPI003C699077
MSDHRSIDEAVSYEEGARNQRPPPLLRMEGITRRFPGVLALDNVDFDLRQGEVHVLFGENGAGKSTLISIVAGARRSSKGRILFRGREIDLHSVYDARQLGISAVFQEFSLVPQMTVGENLFLGAEGGRIGFVNGREINRKATEILDKLGFPLKANQKVAYLSRAKQQMVEIAKALRSELSILILDEPTASLTERETESLFALIDQAKRNGTGIIYITHRISEIKRIADRITVLRDGKYIATVEAGQVSETQLVRLMTGRVIEQIFPKVQYDPGHIVLSLEGLTTSTGTVSDVSLTVRRGEIVGLAGLVGCGKSEVARACFGLEPIASGKVIFENERVKKITPGGMLDRGMFYLPPDRREEGLAMVRSARENITLPSLGLRALSGPLFLRRKAERRMCLDIAKRLNLQPPNVERITDTFSGGNQQKVMLARTLTRDVKLFILDEPTVGVDVGARVAIYEFIRDLCEAGTAVLLVSSDLPEILHLTNRTYVMYRGCLQATLHGADITEENVLRNLFERMSA